jgi:PadR family transcriptional regulator, regulatory protein PadR
MGDEEVKKFQKELNSGAISLVLLSLIVERKEAMYGYEIAKHLQAMSDLALPMSESAIYPVLRSLEKQGLLGSYLERSDSGPPRKYYRATASGRSTLKAWRSAWNTMKVFVESVLEGNDESVDETKNKSRSSRSSS